jgi:hypothetical protein
VRTSHAIALALLALLYTLVNCPKPLTIDDSAYYYYAAHIARDPLDPYGFTVFWWQWPDPANEVLAPPLLPYWWALAIRLFGEQPFLWKLWLLPFSLLFVFALHALARRFARGLELPLVGMTVLSPAFLPSLNLMLDVPALALSLSGLALFLRACDRRSFLLAMLAGVVAGLAIETKYTGFLGPAAMVLYALLSRRFSLALAAVAVGCAALVFVGWESFMHQAYGSSHFLYHYKQSGGTPLWQKVEWFALPLVTLLGALAPAVACLGLAALGRGWKTISGAVGLVMLAYAVVTATATPIPFSRLVDKASRLVDKASPEPADEGIAELWLEQITPHFPHKLSPEEAVFTILGGLTCIVLAAVAWRLCRPIHGLLLARLGWWRAQRLTWFLVLWLGLEVAGYFALTPFAAVRRVLGVMVVSTLLTGRLASLACRSPRRRGLVYGIALGSAVLGLGYAAVDFREAQAEKDAAEMAARLIRQQEEQERAGFRPESVAVTAGASEAGLPAALPWAAVGLSGGEHTIWYVGHWGFQHYAEGAGMVPVVPDRSMLRPGDWLVVPWGVHQQMIVIDLARADVICDYPSADAPDEDPWPYRTIMCFYSDAAGVPLRHRDGRRLAVRIYRVRAAFIPQTPSE